MSRLPSLHPSSSAGRGRTALAGALLVTSALYFVAELVAASAWQVPYSWTGNMISDLGVPECLGHLSPEMTALPRYVCSPRHVVMNWAFVVVGALGVVAALVARPRLPRPWDRVVLALAAANGVAMACVGLFPGSAGEFPNGPAARIVVHPVAAYAEHVTGMGLMAVLVLLSVRHHRALAALTALLFAVSGLAAITILWGNPAGAGGTERAAIDPFLWWRLILGLVLLGTAARLPAHAEPAAASSPRRTR